MAHLAVNNREHVSHVQNPLRVTIRTSRKQNIVSVHGFSDSHEMSIFKGKAKWPKWPKSIVDR